MKSYMRGVLVVGGLLGLSGAALAGEQLVLPVEVNLSKSYAQGGVGDARGSSDTRQMIGCQISASVGSSYIICEARNASGVYKSCTSSDPHLRAAAQSIGPASYIGFFWNSAGDCVHLSVGNVSTVKPSSP